MKQLRWLVVLALAVGAVVSPRPAHACGGCFHPPNPTGTPSEVNAHRMAFLTSPRESILWDQIQYTGSPSDFVWVLPVMGNPTVEVADNGFFESLVSATRITMIGPLPPPTFCPDPCAPWSASIFFGGASASRGAPFFDAGTTVNVLHEGVVGPYETATIMSTDANALVDWLRGRGYQVPSSTLPIIDHYVRLGMNFVALRLQPTAGVDRMAPIRIRSPGLSLTLPLRMIAAGAGAQVDLELFVFAEGRMQTANFPNAEVDRAAITYDWASDTFDYDARFEDALFAGSGTLTNWVTEYAEFPIVSQLAAYRSGSPPNLHSAHDDMAIVTADIGVPFLTRLRTRLPVSQLDTDLTLSASDGGQIGTTFDVTREVHRAPDPICETYCPTGSDGLGGSSVRGTGSSYRCAIAPGREGATAVLAAFVAAAAWLMERRRR